MTTAGPAKRSPPENLAFLRTLLLERVAATARAEALEEAAKVADAEANRLKGLIEPGKGAWPSAGYVRDETWAGGLRAESVARHVAQAIRALISAPLPPREET